MVEDKSIWILEDEKDHLDLLMEIFSIRYKVKAFDNIKEFISFYNNGTIKKPDIIIADLMLKGSHFFDIFSETTDIDLNTPFIIVSSLGDIDALRYCFDEGAIDYLIKPFKKNELLAKVEVHLRKIESLKEVEKKKTLSDKINFDTLTVKEGKILKCLLEAGDYRAHRQELIHYIWGTINVHPKTLDVHMYNLRKKIKKNGYAIRAEGDGHFCLELPETVN